MTGTIIAIGAAAAVLTGIGAGIGIGIATAKAVDAIARQPEAEGKISKNLILGCALAEANRYLRIYYRDPDHLLPAVRKCSLHSGRFSAVGRRKAGKISAESRF